MSILTKSIDFPHYKITGNQKIPTGTIENFQVLFNELMLIQTSENHSLARVCFDDDVVIIAPYDAIDLHIFNTKKDSLFYLRLLSIINKYRLPASIIKFLSEIDMTQINEVAE